MPKHVHHAIDYIELTQKDVAQAKAFYAAAFGWTFNDYGPDYCGIRKEGGEAGGFAKGKPKPGGPLIVLFSKDLKKTFAAVKKAGGKIDKPIFDFPGGQRFEFSDPSGNKLGVWAEP